MPVYFQSLDNALKRSKGVCIYQFLCKSFHVLSDTMMSHSCHGDHEKYKMSLVLHGCFLK